MGDDMKMKWKYIGEQKKLDGGIREGMIQIHCVHLWILSKEQSKSKHSNYFIMESHLVPKKQKRKY